MFYDVPCAPVTFLKQCTAVDCPGAIAKLCMKAFTERIKSVGDPKIVNAEAEHSQGREIIVLLVSVLSRDGSHTLPRTSFSVCAWGEARVMRG